MSALTATHPGDQTGWTTYSGKDAGVSVINAGADLDVLVTNYSITQTTKTDFDFNPDTSTSLTTDSDFATGATYSNTTVLAGSVKLKIAAQSPVWTANASWNSPDIGSYASPGLADLDGDGDLDLMAGEYSGLFKAYENTGSDVSPVWIYNSALNGPHLGTYSSASALADLDNDGDVDLLAGHNTGAVRVYENTGTSLSPVWTANTAWDTPDVGSYSSPAVADLDNDGDFDLIIGEGLGVSFGYENTGSVAAPVWTAKPLWDTVDIGGNSSPTLADLDGDGDYDLMIGDQSGVSYGYENTGTNNSPTWTANAAWNVYIAATIYAKPALADIDIDGDNDLLIGVNNGVVYAYENTGSVYYASGTFTSSVVDTGVHADFSILDFTAVLPANTALTVDIRAGDTPAPDGSWTAWQIGIANGGDISALGYNRYVQYRANLDTTDTSVSPSLADISFNYINFPTGSNLSISDTGSVTLGIASQSPVWTANPVGNLPDVGVYSAPEFADLDNDGDQDVVIGDSNGISHAYENTGSDASPVWTTKPAWNLPTFGIYVAYSLANLDGDGDLDAMLGEVNGATNAYENTGSVTAPVWIAKPAWNIGDIGTYSTPEFVDLDNDGDYDLLLGEFNSSTRMYLNTGSSTSPVWTYQSAWNVPYVGTSRGRPAAADLDADGDYDVMIGGYDGVSYGFENTGSVTSPVWTANATWNIVGVSVFRHVLPL